MFKLLRWFHGRCNHNYVMYGNKARTVYTPMICTKCGKFKYNDEAIRWKETILR